MQHAICYFDFVLDDKETARAREMQRYEEKVTKFVTVFFLTCTEKIKCL